MSSIRSLMETRIAALVDGSSVKLFREVAGAAGMQNIMAGRISDRACYIFQEGAAPGRNERVNAVSQREVVQFAVIITVKNVADPRGGDADDASQAYRDAVQASLLGWEPAAGWEMFEKAGGQLLSFANGFLITKDSYRTAHYIRYTP